MARKHGWELPTNKLQIIAITVFFILVVAFYVFLAPFLGRRILEYAAIAVYTFAALAVFILYIRCTSINPSDPGIMSKFEDGFISLPANNDGLQGIDLPQKTNTAIGVHSPTSTCRSSLDDHSNQRGSSMEDVHTNLRSQLPNKRSSCFCFGGLVCALFVKEDCQKGDDSEQLANGEEEAMFCTLCNAEVRKFNKNCRSCDKCVDGFDHHCQWLNNCVGRKNYFTFIALMAISLLLLAVEVGASIAVIVLCFVNKNASKNIDQTLGLTCAPFAVIVGMVTSLSLLAFILLGELFVFHMILIRKGITTYHYMVAMRTMSEALPEDEEGANSIYSPTNSVTTGFSVGSSLGLHHRGAWCTPPRVFIDQDEVIPHLDPRMVPSTVDPDSAGYAERANKAKKPVKISARSLAKLDRNDVLKAAAKARAFSSILRPIYALGGHEADLCSSDKGSNRSSMSFEYSSTKEYRTEMRPSPLQNLYPQSLASQEDYDAQSASSLSSPVHIHRLASHSQFHVASRSAPPPQRPSPGIARPPIPVAHTANSMFRSAASYARDNRRASVVWDQDAGRYVSVAAQTRAVPGVELPGRNPGFLANPSGEPGKNGRNLAPANTSSSAMPPGQPSERLTYTGQSVFFGGPILSTACINAGRNESGTSARPQRSRDPHAHQRHTRGERARTGPFPVFEPRNL